MRGIAGQPVLPGLDRVRKRGLEERQRGVLVTGRATEPAAFEVDADQDTSVLLDDLVEEPVALLEAVAQPFHPRKLCQRLGAQRPEARLGRVEVVEVPERAEWIAHRPVVEKCW